MSTELTVRLPEELVERYEALVRTTGRTQDYYVIKAMELSIDELETTYIALSELKDWRGDRTESITADEARRACRL